MTDKELNDLISDLIAMYRWAMLNHAPPNILGELYDKYSSLHARCIRGWKSPEDTETFLLATALTHTVFDLCNHTYYNFRDARERWMEDMVSQHELPTVLDEYGVLEQIIKFADWAKLHENDGERALEKCEVLLERMSKAYFGGRDRKDAPHGELMAALMWAAYEKITEGIKTDAGN